MLGQHHGDHAGVLLAHPGTQHSWATARALQRADLLQTFVTLLDYDPARFPYSLVSHLPEPWRTTMAARLARRMVRIPDRRAVQTPFLWPLAITAATALSKGRPRRKLARLNDTLLDRWLSRRLCGYAPLAVHCFEGAALHTFSRARRLGIPTVLDVASDHTGHVRVLQEETRRLRGELPEATITRHPARILPYIFEERTLADYLLAPSEYVRDILLSEGVPAARIVMMPYGVDVAQFTPPTEPCGGRTCFTALFAGAVSVGKGIPYLLRAWRELALPNARLRIVGGINDRNMRLLRDRADSGVEWIGNVPRSEMLRQYHEADVFIFPSLSESFGRVVSEAMACALPVITTPAAGSVVRDGVDGFIVPLRDVAALRHRIRLLYDDRELRARMGQGAREHVTQHYTWDQYERRLARFYREVVFAATAQRSG